MLEGGGVSCSVRKAFLGGREELEILAFELEMVRQPSHSMDSGRYVGLYP